jgi:2-methylcitrate dehydratase PrpD
VTGVAPIARILADFAAGTCFERLPAPVVSSVKDRVLDTLGICLASSAFGLGDGVHELVGGWGGRPEASAVGARGRYPAPQAAFVNGTLAHSLDFDDTHLPSVLHPSASIVPAGLAMAQATRASGAATLAAIAIGLEVTVRVGLGGYLAEQGNVFFNRGWHATSICGTLGAAVTGALLMGLDAEGVQDALGIAASMGAGVIEANRAGGTVKRLHCGWAAHAGLTAAALARNGYTGPPTVFEGHFGFFRAFLGDDYDLNAVVNGLGDHWEVPGIFFKPYPANHYTHAGIDAALAVVRARGGAIDPQEVRRIELGVASAPLHTIGEPREEKIRPRSGYHAQFSGPFTVATALLGGGGLGVYFDDFTDERARDERVLALARKVETYVDPECDRIFPREFPAVLRVHMNDGQTYEHRVMRNRGGPGNPLSVADLQEKFRLNAEHTLSSEQTALLSEAVLELDRAPDLERLLSLTLTEGDGQ